MTTHTAHASRPLSVYVHVPFCVQKCNYCDFCSFPKSSDAVKARYTEEICRRIEAMRETVSVGEYGVETVYFGGADFAFSAGSSADFKCDPRGVFAS